MGFLSYLPSAQFTLIVASVAVSGGLVFAAERFTTEEKNDAQLAAAEHRESQELADWQKTLEEIQAESGATSPPPPPQEAYQALLSAAQSDNVTQGAARTLFINLSSASAQGLGSDIPTQEELIEEIFAQVDRAPSIVTYTSADIALVANTPETLHAYGNALIQTLRNHPQASVNDTLLAVGYAVEHDDKTYFEKLAPIGVAYRALTQDLLLVPVPSTMAPLHLTIINNFSRIAQTFADMRTMPTDPLRGLGGLHTFYALTNEVKRVFTTIAQQLQQNAILFTEDEPGSAWSVFLPV